MTFRQFAFNNVKRNARQYITYFLSCMFSVTIFFMYAVLVFHPEVMETEFRESVRRSIMAAEIIIFVFSFLFVLYSNSTFVKSRKKEFGLLSTLGISRSQLNRLIMMENSLIGILSIILGLAMGAIFSKLFLLTLTNILELGDPLSYYISPLAIGITAGAYFIMFELNSIFVLFSIRTKTIMELFRGARSPKKKPKFSWILSILSLLLIGYGYYLAWTADLISIIPRMLPILALVVPGSYFLFTQLSVALTSLLQKRKSLYYKGTHLLTISDLIFKLRDNSRILFFVAILSAVAFTSSGVLFGAFYGLEEEAKKYTPNTLSFSGTGNRETVEEKARLVSQELKRNDIHYSAHYSQLVKGEIPELDGSVRFLSLSDFHIYQTMSGLEKLKLKENEAAILLFPNDHREDQVPGSLTVSIQNEEHTFAVKKVRNNAFNSRYFQSYLIVLPDQFYEAYARVSDPEQTVHLHAIEIDGWTSKTDEIQVALQEHNLRHLKVKDDIFTENRAELYTGLKQGFGISLYFGIFISVLFFLAAGSILYFRMYQDIDYDLNHYRSLYRIGLTKKEMKNIATRELSFLFFLPMLIAVLHSSFAFKALQNILSASVLLPAFIIFGGFLGVHLINFFIVRNIYVSKLKRAL